jgi:hypothetical protein
MTTINRRILAIGFAAAAFGLAGCAAEQMAASKTNLAATLRGSAEVPPVNVPGSGSATVTLDKATKTLSWTVTYGGLTGPVRAAHFHGPAAPTANAGIVVPITVSASPMSGSAQLTDAQMADLLAGRWYVNIHTAAHPGGEVRGQVTVAP